MVQDKSRTEGSVILVVVDKPGEKSVYLISMTLDIQVTRLIQAWNQRHWDAYYGHFVLRLIAGFALFYTSRFIFKGHVTMEEIVFTSWLTA